jgi:NAD(P)-dependent dehydrogenase (short-subunit alcohol dehydrogenase family)
MMGRLQGKTAIITGGTSGIGRDATIRFVKEGAKVLFTGRDEKRAAETLAMVKEAGGEAWFEAQDVSDEKDWLRVMEVAASKFETLDILVNCAGMFFIKTIEETTISEMRSMWKANVDSVFLGTKLGIISMRDNPGGGSIVNISSLSALVGHPLCAAYCTTKAATVMLTKSAALDAAPWVRVNAILPGPVWNDLLERTHVNDDIDAMKQWYIDSSPLKLLGDSADVTHGIVYLASDEARNITGTALRIDAGRGAD